MGSFVMMGSLSLFLLFYSFSTVWVTYLHADFDFFIFSFGSVGRDLTEMNGFFFFSCACFQHQCLFVLWVISPSYELFLLNLLHSLGG